VREASRAFTLIELMIVVAIVGILAVLAVFGVNKYMTHARSAEARNSLGHIIKLAGQALDRENNDIGVTAAGSTSAASARRLCGSSIAVPASVPSNKKYQSKDADWSTGTTSTGWRCVRFSVTGPQYYQYQYEGPAASVGTLGEAVFARAHGDLNGDGTTSYFSMQAIIQPGGALTFAGAVEEFSPDE